MPLDIYVRPAKIQISLRVQPVRSAFVVARINFKSLAIHIYPVKNLIKLRKYEGWSESSLCAHVRRYVSWRASYISMQGAENGITV